MPSEVGICSLALNQLGEKSITSFDDGTDPSNLCRDFYPSIRDAVLRAYPWNCAIGRAELPLLAEVPLFGYAHKFTLPVDPYCLRVLEIDDDDAEWKVEGRELHCDNSTMKIKFIKRVTDPGLFDSLLVQAIIFRLAATLSKPITGSTDVALWQLYRNVIQEAQTMDGMEGIQEDWESNALTDVRL